MPRVAGRTVAAVMVAIGGSILAALAPTSISLLILIALVALAITIWLPGILFGMYLLLPFYKAAVHDYSPVDLTLALAFLTSLQIFPVLSMRGSITVRRSVAVLWLLLEMIILGSLLYAPDVALGLDRVLNWSALIFVPVAVGAHPRAIRQLLWLFFALGALIVFLGITQLSSDQRLAVLGINTIAVGRGALLVPLLAVMFVLPRASLPLQVITVVLIPASFVVALASGSRGPIVVLIVLAVVMGWRWLFQTGSRDPRAGRTVLAVAVASIAVAFVAATNIPGESLERFANLGEFTGAAVSGGADAASDTSAGARVTLFESAWAMFEDHPLIGAGAAGFAAISARYAGVNGADEYPHNAFLQFAAEHGVVGLAVFGAFVVMLLVRRPREASAAAVRGLALFFLLNAKVSGNVFEDRTLWGLILLVLLMTIPDARTPDVATTQAPFDTLRPSGRFESTVKGVPFGGRQAGHGR